MGFSRFQDVSKNEVAQSFISKLYGSIAKDLPFAEPTIASRTNESELVQGVLQMLQGFSSSLFYWDDSTESFCVKNGIYVSHLSQTSLGDILSQFVFGATCFKLVDRFVKKVDTSNLGAPTLKAFANSISLWLKRLRNVALKEEMKSAGPDSGVSSTLLGLTNSLSSLCSGAEHLLQIVYGAIPSSYFDSESSISSGEMAVHILDHLCKKLNESCLVQGGEEEGYHMLLVIFVGSLLPYLQGLDSWLYDGTLDDPYEEMFFYANNAVAIDQPAFWEKSYLFRPWICRSSISGNNKSVTQDKKELRSKESIMSSSGRANEQNEMDLVVCPMFLKNIARAIVSAGKSLQLVRHVRDEYVSASDNGNGYESHNLGINDSFASGRPLNNHIHQVRIGPECMSSPMCEDGKANNSFSNDYSGAHLSQAYHSLDMGGMGILTLSEVFLVSLVGLVCDGSHVCEYFTRVCPCSPEISQICKAYMDREKLERETGESVKTQTKCEKIWFKYLVEIVSQKNRQIDSEREFDINCTNRDANCFVDSKEVKDAVKFCALKWSLNDNDNMDLATMVQSFSPENPVITVCGDFLNKNTASWDKLNISRNFHLPPLNDENLREAIFGESLSDACLSIDHVNRDTISRLSGTDYTFGFKFGEFESFRLLDDAKTLETLYPFPTLLPCFQEKYPISALLPYQKNSTFASRILNWIQNIKLKAMPLPAVIVHECLVLYIRKQVDNVGKHILLRLMGDWRLMDELGVLRAIYLLGSGDLLQQFLIVIFDRLDRGESWDDEFELNTILQDSIRNSADGTLLSAPDSLTVSITKHDVSDNEEHGTSLVTTPHKVRSQSFGINALDQLKFTYKVSWPLDLIANMEAIKKYNQVMGFLLKVKRAKFVLDKARRWMWKGKGRMTRNSKHHMLVEQKLLHFVDAFHQYVMDRVFHSAWLELCNGMASAGSLDEVIEVHEAYLLSIQRQCFVAPDKLWALIASRIKSILGLALDFYSIQQTLSSGGAAPAIKARCEMEVDRIEKQFDDCIAFLLRILSFKLNLGHFPHLADLVTRINYNYFYMSDNGNLLTTPSFETGATKLGKTFPGKTS